jgi:CRP-like cAMP-binding protein
MARVHVTYENIFPLIFKHTRSHGPKKHANSAVMYRGHTMNTREDNPETYYYVLYLRAVGTSIAAIADATGYSRRHVLRILAEARDEHANRAELSSVA